MSGILSHGHRFGCYILLSIPVFILCSINMVSAQETTGIITETTGRPLPKVHVLEKESMHSTLSDFSGRFSISINEDSFWCLTFIIDKSSLKTTVNSTHDIKIKWSKAKQFSFHRRNFEERGLYIILITPKHIENNINISITNSQVK